MEGFLSGVARGGPGSRDAVVPVFFVFDRERGHDCAEEVAVESRVVSPSVRVGVGEDEAVDGGHGWVLEFEVGGDGEV